MRARVYTLVYQGGIANVFRHLTGESERQRIMQSDFRSCEHFCRGLKEGGHTVFVAWCNEAGDIRQRPWNTTNFDNAPFHDSFGMAPVEPREPLFAEEGGAS